MQPGSSAISAKDQQPSSSQSEAQERLAQIEARETLFESLVDQARARRYSRRPGQRFESLSALDRAAAIARDLKLPAERLDPLRDEAIACLALPDLRPEPGSRNDPQACRASSRSPSTAR